MRNTLMLAAAALVAAASFAPSPAAADPYHRGGPYREWRRHEAHRGYWRHDGWRARHYGYGYGRGPGFYAPRHAYARPPGVFIPFR